MKGFKNVMYLSLALGLLLYAVPQLEIGGGWTLPTVFAIAWISFALLVIGAQLHHILRVDEETRKELANIKRMKRWRLQQRLEGKSRMLQVRK